MASLETELGIITNSYDSYCDVIDSMVVLNILVLEHIYKAKTVLILLQKEINTLYLTL